MQIVFVHGSGQSGASWQLQTRAFVGSDALDLPGHPDGESLPSVEACVDWLKATLDEPSLLAPMQRESFAKLKPELVNDLVERSEANGAAAFLNDLRACDRFDIIDRLSEIAIPTLAICGTEDVMTPPKYSQFLADRIAGAEVKFIEGGTHMVFLEQPDAVNSAIAEFLEGLA